MGVGKTSTSKGGGAANLTRSIHKQVAEVVDCERRLTAIFEQKLQAQELKFMGMLERVVESNEVIKQQMGRDIYLLRSQVSSLED